MMIRKMINVRRKKKMKKEVHVLCKEEKTLLCSSFVFYYEKKKTYKPHKNESDTSLTKLDHDCFM
jgi:hypothetical protein